jgi:hypothetical protein
MTTIDSKNVDVQLGAYTGPESGIAQDDNVKAANDLIKTDTELILANQNNTGDLLVGQVYSLSKAAATTATTDELFTVAGGAIEIISCFGQVTTIIAGAPGNVSLGVNATAGATHDADFTAVVALADNMFGDVITMDALSGGENTQDATVNTNAGIPLSWFCPAGVIEQTLSSTGTGVVTWFISFRPLETGVTVVVS